MSWQRLLGPLDRLPTEGSLEDWHAAALARDDYALEDLDAGTGSLNDLDVDLEGVPGTEGGDVVAQ